MRQIPFIRQNPLVRPGSLVVVANRLPVDDTVASEGVSEWRRTPGLISAVVPVLGRPPSGWVGWAGEPGSAPSPAELDGVRLFAVDVPPEEFRSHYEGFANSTLWPLYHDSVEHSVYRRGWWEAYQEVNRRFAEGVAEAAEPGAYVWVHDYHLHLVPGMLRSLRPDLAIGFFMHVPFPPPELFMQLPEREDLLRGLLGADLVGFQRAQASHNFAQLADKVLGLEATDTQIRLPDRAVATGPFPISVDLTEIAELAGTPEVARRAVQLRTALGSPRRMLLSVDRLDYIKGIEHRLNAYSELLEDGRIRPGEVALVQVALPSRERVEQYQSLRDRVEREIGRINGEYGRVGVPAVHYVHRNMDRTELAALYRAADVMVVTPLRDGMNLVAKEFVAARINDDGALVLSEFAGAAEELGQAYLVNPHDADGLKRAILEALQADADEVRRRMRQMREHVREHDIRAWAKRYLSALVASTAEPAATGGAPVSAG